MREQSVDQVKQGDVILRQQVEAYEARMAQALTDRQTIERGICSAMFAIGDIYLDAASELGDNLAASIIDPERWGQESIRTVQHAAWVARHFPKERRREDVFTFGWYAAVATLPEEEADLLLEQAAGEGWTVKTMRDESRKLKKGLAGGEADPKLAGQSSSQSTSSSEGNDPPEELDDPEELPESAHDYWTAVLLDGGEWAVFEDGIADPIATFHVVNGNRELWDDLTPSEWNARRFIRALAGTR